MLVLTSSLSLYLQLALFFAVVWGASAVVFLFSDQFGIPNYVHPIALTCFLLAFAINTLNVCFRHARFWLLKALVGCGVFFILRFSTPILACRPAQCDVFGQSRSFQLAGGLWIWGTHGLEQIDGGRSQNEPD